MMLYRAPRSSDLSPRARARGANATISAVKGIGTFMVIFLIGMGVAVYLVTRSPTRKLDAQGTAWVERYEKWADTTQRQLDRAVVGMSFSSRSKNARLIDPLRRCSVSFARVGEPPALLTSVRELVFEACGRAERAVRVNDRSTRTASRRSISICVRPRARCSGHDARLPFNSAKLTSSCPPTHVVNA